MNDPPAQSKRRFRFSILNMLLLTAIVALSITVAMQWREVGPLRVKVRQLSKQAEVLDVTDIGKLHGMQVVTAEPDRWRFRVWIPDNQKAYWLRDTRFNVPAKGVPVNFNGGSLSSGEHVIDVSIVPKANDENALEDHVFVDSRFSGSGTLIECDHDWIRNEKLGGRRLAYGVPIGPETKSIEAGEPLVLLRYRASGVKNVKRNSEGVVGSYQLDPFPEPCEGFMLWIDALEE